MLSATALSGPLVWHGKQSLHAGLVSIDSGSAKLSPGGRLSLNLLRGSHRIQWWRVDMGHHGDRGRENERI